MTSSINNFGTRLKDLRLQKRLTQQQLGDIIHVSKVSISGYERGERNPDTDTLQDIANYFEVSVDYLLNGYSGFEKKENSSNDKARTIAAHIDDDATEEDLEDILRYIEYRKNNPLQKKK